MEKVIETRSMLPDDIDDLVKFLEGSKQLTLEALRSSETFKRGHDRKTKFASDVEEKYSSLIAD